MFRSCCFLLLENPPRASQSQKKVKSLFGGRKKIALVGKEEGGGERAVHIPILESSFKIHYGHCTSNHIITPEEDAEEDTEMMLKL